MIIQNTLEAVVYRADTILTIGTFDGVHLGHQAILRRVVEQAQGRRQRSVVITFEPHPQTVIHRAHRSEVRILTETPEKAAILDELGVDAMVVINFNYRIAAMTGKQFVEEILLRRIGMTRCILGYDHTFGKGRSGNIHTMRAMAAQWGFEVEEVEPFVFDGVPVKSSAIREYLRMGELSKANDLLGRPYRMRGTVVRGDGRGRSIGIPTANVLPFSAHKLLPSRGVYATRFEWAGKRYPSVTNIGSRPTFSAGSELLVETHVLDLNTEFYGQDVTLEFLVRLRDEQQFASSDELIERIREDIHYSRTQVFSNY
jgi:riboflavin kinase/FMN adenylyltransferase